MSVKIEFYADTALDAAREISDFVRCLSFSPATPVAPLQAPIEQPQPEAPKPAATRGKGKKENTPAPEIKPETAETQAQDAADEAAEEGTAQPDRVYTADDVRAVGGAYMKKYGAPAAQADCGVIYKECGHAGKISECKDGAVLKAITDAIQAALDSNRFEREAV